LSEDGIGGAITDGTGSETEGDINSPFSRELPFPASEIPFPFGGSSHPFGESIGFHMSHSGQPSALTADHLQWLTHRIGIVAVLLQRLQGKPRGGSKAEIEEHVKAHVVEPPHSEDEEPDSCAICLDDLCVGTCVSKLSCGHCFHEPCASKWLGINKSCPVCKLCITERREPRPATKSTPKSNTTALVDEKEPIGEVEKPINVTDVVSEAAAEAN